MAPRAICIYVSSGSLLKKGLGAVCRGFVRPRRHPATGFCSWGVRGMKSDAFVAGRRRQTDATGRFWSSLLSGTLSRRRRPRSRWPTELGGKTAARSHSNRHDPQTWARRGLDPNPRRALFEAEVGRLQPHGGSLSSLPVCLTRRADQERNPRAGLHTPATPVLLD